MKRLPLTVLFLGLSGFAAACSPSGPRLMAGPMVTTNAASNGYSGTGQFSCGAGSYAVTGTGSSIDIQLARETVTLVGGPLVYAGASNSITFQPGYGSFEWIAGTVSLTCTRA